MEIEKIMYYFFIAIAIFTIGIVIYSVVVIFKYTEHWFIDTIKKMANDNSLMLNLSIGFFVGSVIAIFASSGWMILFYILISIASFISMVIYYRVKTDES